MRTPLSVPRRQRRSETSEHSAPALTRGPPEPGRAPVQRIDSVVVRPAHPRATARGRPRRPSRRAALSPLHNDSCGERRARRRAAGGVVASRAARRTKTLPATKTNVSQYEARSGSLSSGTLRTTCHGKRTVYESTVPCPSSSPVVLSLAGAGRRARGTVGTWLILPVVICLSQRLSHAGLSTGPIRRNCEWLIKSVMVP
jgi:hypothetical protein